MPLENQIFYSAKSGLERNEVPDGYVVYDEQNENVIFLNPTAAVILELCDGTRDRSAITSTVATLFGLETAPDASVESCLSTLLTAGLIEELPRP